MHPLHSADIANETLERPWCASANVDITRFQWLAIRSLWRADSGNLRSTCFGLIFEVLDGVCGLEAACVVPSIHCFVWPVGKLSIFLLVGIQCEMRSEVAIRDGFFAGT